MEKLPKVLSGKVVWKSESTIDIELLKEVISVKKRKCEFDVLPSELCSLTWNWFRKP